MPTNKGGDVTSITSKSFFTLNRPTKVDDNTNEIYPQKRPI